MAWTKASVDSGQHTYAEALALMQAAGFPKSELDEFLRFNPGDLYRVPEAFDLATGGVDPLSTGQVARAPIVAPIVMTTAPPTQIAAASGGPASLFMTVDGLPTPSSAYPAREASGLVNSSAGSFGQMFASAPSGASGSRIPWMLLLAVAAGVWILAKGGKLS